MSAYGAAIRIWHMMYHSVVYCWENCGGAWRKLVPATGHVMATAGIGVIDLAGSSPFREAGK
jgi:hypothetical protein